MKGVRSLLTAAALAIGLTASASATGLLALATPVHPAAGVTADAVASAGAAAAADAGQSPDADPDVPAPPPPDGTDQIGSVSVVAANLLEQQTSNQDERLSPGRSASPAAKSEAIWASRGRPSRLIIVRRGSIDTVSRGRLQEHLVRFVSTITIRSLAAAVPSSWLSIDGSTARLSATVVLTTGVTLSVGAPVSTLLLTGGATPAAAATVYVGAGALTVRGVRVTSSDPLTGAPMPDGSGRPYISVAGGGRLNVIDATVSNLGATIGTETFAGLVFGTGSHGSVVQTALVGNSVGAMLRQSDGVLLENVTASQSLLDGIVLSGDTDSSLVDVAAENNGANGVDVTGKSSPRPITGIAARGNHDFGLVVAGQTGPRISEIVTTGNGAGGVEINHSNDVVISGLTTTGEPAGVYSHVSSTHIALDHLNIVGGRRGVVVEKTTTDVTMTESKVTGADLGVSLGGHQMQLTDVSIADSQTAAVVERGAGNAGLERLTINGGKYGFIANPGTSGVVVRDLAADDVSTTAVRALSPGEQILGGRIDGSVTGIDVQAPTTLTGVTIVGSDTGVRARTPRNILTRQVDIAAISVGINIADGTPFMLADSRVHALESIRGTVVERGANDLSLPALSLLGAIGVPLILLALLLEMAAVLRQRRSARRRRAAAGPMDPPAPAVRTDYVTAGSSR